MDQEFPEQSGLREVEARTQTWSEGGAVEGDQRPIRGREYKPTPNDFVLQRLLGKGGSGEIWEAVQTSLWRTVAVKRIEQGFLRENRNRPRKLSAKENEFQQEAIVTALLDHPAIVPIYELGRGADDQPLLAMKLVQGERWSEVLARDLGAMAYPDYLSKHLTILIQMAQAVAFAHSRGIIHRDLKPSQVMLGRYGEVYLMDWGLALFIGEGTTVEQELVPEVLAVLPRRADAINPAGTPGMMAPEQAEASTKHLSYHTDVFLLGATLYWLLTGTTPHAGKSVADVLRAAKTCAIESPEKRAPQFHVPPTLSSLAMRCMRREHTDRIPSVKAFIAGILDYLSGAVDRAESMRLTERAKEQLEENGREYSSDEVPVNMPASWQREWGRPGADAYDVYTEVLNLLDQAIRLWPQNPDVHPLKAGVLTGYAWAAVESADLRLARALAFRIEDPKHRKALLKIIGSRERTATSMARQRFLASAAITVLALLLVLGGLKYTGDLQKARDQSETTRKGAEGVMNFLLGSLHQELAGAGRLDLLESIGNQAIAYYESLPSSEISPQGTIAYIQALRQVGEVRLHQGSLDEAERHFVRAKELASTHDGGPESRQAYLLEAATLDYDMGELYKRRGDYGRSTRHFEEAETWLRATGPTGENGNDVPRLAAYIKGQMGSIALARGNVSQARELFQEQLMIREKLVEENPGEAVWLDHLATTYLQFGWALLNAGDFAGYRDSVSRSLELRREALAIAPTKTGSRFMFARTNIEVAKIHLMMEKLAESREALQAAEKELNALLDLDGRNAEWIGEMATCREVHAQVETKAGNHELAMERLGEVLKAREQLYQASRTSANYRSAVAVTIMMKAEVAGRMENRTEEALELASRAVNLMGEMVALIPDNKDWQRLLWRSQMLKANLLQSAGRLKEAELVAIAASETAEGVEPFLTAPNEMTDPEKKSGEVVARVRSQLAEAGG